LASHTQVASNICTIQMNFYFLIRILGHSCGGSTFLSGGMVTGQKGEWRWSSSVRMLYLIIFPNEDWCCR